ncbi:hypothetical protein WJX72_004828 [[Myrmecia] bisecta]|uniref:non-specific serine/threonine protein kinase n=1 Tax=[Myrmecia] bisecta TaxID=41462 RepID=A0AAW1P634_9CHLO
MQPLGRGQFSQVYVAKHLRTGIQVALKKVQIFDIMDAKQRNDCIKEVRILLSLDHPNIVQCLDYFIEDNELVIVLEWAQAGDLQQLINKRREQGQPFDEPHVWAFFAQICGALRHMHERRMMHRDIKPSNIFLTADGTLKLGDLGLSRYFSSKTMQAQSMVGTPYYMSPECIKGVAYDWSSDMWSLGCLLYEIAALRSPFYQDGLNYYTLGKSISSGQYQPLPDSCPDSIRDLVARLLVPDPKQRPAIQQVHDYAEGMLHALCATQNGHAPTRRPSQTRGT